MQNADDDPNPSPTQAIMEADMTKEIPVMGSTRPAIVDDDDFEWASKHEWFADGNGFVVRWRQPDEEGMADDNDVIEMGTEVYCRYHRLPLSRFHRPRRT
jgi:hypothetical protein